MPQPPADELLHAPTPPARGMSNQSVFGTGSRLVYDVLMNSENREFIYQGLSAMLTGAGFSGTFSAYGFTVAVNGAALPAGSTALYCLVDGQPAKASSSRSIRGRLVITIIIYIVLSMMECNEDEARLALKEGAALCHTIGNYCSSCIRILGRLRVVRRAHHRQVLLQLDARAHRQSSRGARRSARAGAPRRTPIAAASPSPSSSASTSPRWTSPSSTRRWLPKNPNLATLQGNNASRIPACYFGQGKCQMKPPIDLLAASLAILLAASLATCLPLLSAAQGRRAGKRSRIFAS